MTTHVPDEGLEPIFRGARHGAARASARLGGMHVGRAGAPGMHDLITPPCATEAALLRLDGLRRRDAMLRAAGSVHAGYLSPVAGRIVAIAAMLGSVADVHHELELARLRATAWGRPHAPPIAPRPALGSEAA